MTYGVFGVLIMKVWLDGEPSNKWHQSTVAVSGFNGLNSITTRLTYFKSADDEGRITSFLGLGFSLLLSCFINKTTYLLVFRQQSIVLNCL
jgi:hypothetical protein